MDVGNAGWKVRCRDQYAVAAFWGSGHDLMAAAHSAMLELEEFTLRSRSKATAATITSAMQVCSAMCEHRQVERMAMPQTHQFQTAVELLRARLLFFGESV